MTSLPEPAAQARAALACCGLGEGRRKREEAMTLHPQTCVNVRVNHHGAVSRRGFLRTVSAGAVGLGLFDWLMLHADEVRKAHKHVILLWMAGGPSQFETFDPKPGADTQGP